MAKLAFAIIAGALAVLATPASAQHHNRGHHGGHHAHASHQFHSQYRSYGHSAHGHHGHHRVHHVYYRPAYHAPAVTYVQPQIKYVESNCSWVITKHGYHHQKVWVCHKPVHQVKHVEAAPAPVAPAPEVAPPTEEVPK